LACLIEVHLGDTGVAALPQAPHLEEYELFLPHVMSYNLPINILFAKAISTLFEGTQMAL
jgi:hypothetical protein